MEFPSYYNVISVSHICVYIKPFILQREGVGQLHWCLVAAITTKSPPSRKDEEVVSNQNFIQGSSVI